MNLYSLLAFTSSVLASLPVLGQHPVQPSMKERKYREFNLTSSYYVNANALNLRIRPSIKSPVLLRLRSMALVTVVRIINDHWAEVTMGSHTGYVAHAYLSELVLPDFSKGDQ